MIKKNELPKWFMIMIYGLEGVVVIVTLVYLIRQLSS